MNKKKYWILGVMVAAIILILSASYAYFLYNITEHNNFKIKVGNLELSINDTQSEDNIVLDYLKPMLDKDALEENGYTFTVTNTGSVVSQYSIYLEDVLLEKEIDRLDNRYVKINVWDSLTETNIQNYYDYYMNKPLKKGTLAPGEHIDYELKLWLDYGSDNDAQNKYFATKIRIEAHQVNENLEENY